MKIETYLNAMRKALIQRECFVAFTPMWHKKYRQANIFYAHILRMDARKNVRIGDLEHQIMSWGDTCARQHDEIERLRRNNATFANSVVRESND